MQTIGMWSDVLRKDEVVFTEEIIALFTNRGLLLLAP